MVILSISGLTWPLTFRATNEILKYEGLVLEIKEIADDELHKAFSSLKSNKSPGYDDISSSVVKLSDCNWTRTHNHLVHKRTLNG